MEETSIKHVLIGCKTTNKKYIGGVAAIVNSYLANSFLFEKNNIKISHFDFAPKRKIFNISSLENLRVLFAERAALTAYTKKNDYDIFHIHSSRGFLFFKDIYLGKLVSKKYSKKVVITIHVGDIDTVFAKLPRWFKKKSIKILNKYFYRVVFLSKTIKEQFVDAGLDDGLARVLYNFFDFHSDNVEFPLFKRKGCLNIAFMGMINRDKGIIELLQAINQTAVNLHLDVCGVITDKSVENEFKLLIEKLHDRVTLHGYVQGERKVEILRNADVLVLPSYHEGFPLVIIEALASACGIIATPVGAIPEVLSNLNYISVDIKSIDQIRDAITYLNDNNDFLEEMKRRNYDESRKYCVDHHVKRLCQIYQGE